jgi:hypothetical protein
LGTVLRLFLKWIDVMNIGVGRRRGTVRKISGAKKKIAAWRKIIGLRISSAFVLKTVIVWKNAAAWTKIVVRRQLTSLSGLLVSDLWPVIPFAPGRFPAREFKSP